MKRINLTKKRMKRHKIKRKTNKRKINKKSKYIRIKRKRNISAYKKKRRKNRKTNRKQSGGGNEYCAAALLALTSVGDETEGNYSSSSPLLIEKLIKNPTELKKAWDVEKKDVVITKHLAMVYQELENDAEAQKYFAEALKNCEEKSEREDILNSMERRILRRLPASLLVE